jgi:hypothetical protein
VLATALAAESAARAGSGTATVAFVDAVALLLVLVALVRPWEDGLVAGAVLLLLAYTLSLAFAHRPLDNAAPLVAVGLVALVELGSWSLELRDGPEERPGRRLVPVLLLLAGSAVVSALVWSAGSVRSGGGIGLLVLGAGAGLGLLALLTGWTPARRRAQ